jgi:hypothetical protein
MNDSAQHSFYYFIIDLWKIAFKVLIDKNHNRMPQKFYALLFVLLGLTNPKLQGQAGTKDLNFGAAGQVTYQSYPTDVIPIEVGVSDNLIFVFNSQRIFRICLWRIPL